MRAFHLIPLAAIAALLLPASSIAGKKEGGPLSSKAGYDFLSDFQCDSKGDVTRRVQESMTQLHNDLQHIDDKEQECKAALEAINFPSLQKIIDRFQADSELREIDEQQKALTEALADEATINALTQANPNDPAIRRDYPPVSVLDVTIQNAQSTLLTLRSQAGYDKAGQRTVQYTAGATELNSLGEQLAQSLRSGKDCYNKSPVMRKHVTAAILGISGFFLSSPLGVATTVAGKLLQQVFAINESPDRLAEAEKNEDSANLVAGLSCAYEFLGKQHCRIQRERTLYTAMIAADKGDKSSLASLKAGMRTQAKVSEATSRLEAWSDKTKTASSDQGIQGPRLAAASYFAQKSGDFQQQLLQAQEAARVASATGDPQRVAQTLRSKLTTALWTISSVMNPDLRGMGNRNNGGMVDMSNGAGAEYLSNNVFLQDEQRRDFLTLLFDDPQTQEQMLLALQSEYTAKQKAINANNLVSDTSAMSLFSRMAGDPKLQGETYRKIASMLESPDMPQKLLGKLQQLTNRVSAETTVVLSDDQVNSLVQEFRNGPNPLLRSASPQASLLAIRDALNQAKPKLEGTAADAFDATSGRAKLKADVDGMIALADKATAPGASQKDQVDFMKSVHKTFGKNRDLVGRLNTLFDSLGASNMDLLDAEVARTKNTDLKLQAQLLVNESMLKDTIGYPSNPSSRFADYDTAQLLSGGELDAFTNFTQSYLPRAFKFLKGEDVSQGMKDNIPAGARDRLCITLLAMTNIDKQVIANCSGAKITSGKTEVTFDSLMGLPQPKRACALYDFQVHERFDRENDLKGSGVDGKTDSATPAK